MRGSWSTTCNDYTSDLFLPHRKTNKHTVYVVTRRREQLICNIFSCSAVGTHLNTKSQTRELFPQSCHVVFVLFFLYLSDCAASPTFTRIAILSFCLKPLHSHGALHVCSHDNLSSPRSSSLLTSLPSPALQGKEKTEESQHGLVPQRDSRTRRFICHQVVREDRMPRF